MISPENIPLRTPILRNLIGAEVLVHWSGSLVESRRVIQDVAGRNICFSDQEWHYFNEISKIQLLSLEYMSVINPEEKDEFAVKYRKGYPTKKSLNELVELFRKERVTNFVLYPCQNYGRYSDWYKFNWSRKHTEEHMQEFIDWATEEHGLKFGEYRPYDGMSTGMVRISKKEK